MVISGPIMGRREIFSLSKVIFAIWVSGLLYFVIPVPTEITESISVLVMQMVIEFIIGYIIGLVADMLVIAIEFAGNLMDTQAGLSVASLLDPSSGRNITLIAQVLKWTSMIIFLQIDGHHMVLATLVQSFKVIPITSPVDIANAGQIIVGMGKDIFEIGVTLAAPILMVVFVVDFAFGLLNRVAEQINVFQLGFQIKPSVSLLIFLAISPGLINSIYGILEMLSERILQILIVLQG